MDDRKKIAELEADLEGMRKDKDVEMRRLAADMVQIEAKLMRRIAKLWAELVDGWTRNRELERKMTETKKKNEDLEAQLNEIQQELVEARGKIYRLETEIKCEQKERSDGFTKINSKISQSDDRSTQIDAELKVEIDSKVAEMSKIISMKMAQIETDLMGENAETKKKNDDLEAQLRLQNTEVRDGKANIGELEGKINALESKNFDLETQINRTITFLDLDGWSYLAKTASWYKVVDQPMTFDEAKAYCAIRKSHLVSIQSQVENDFVQELAKAVDSNAGFWIGLKKNLNKGNAFEWTDRSSVDFTNWLPGYPDSETHAVDEAFLGEIIFNPPIQEMELVEKV
ncbi:unnamed protein product, partial [Mesorhabditis belari]|uniref:C-type lectin domain-containing protein n=1 Tax=Mesorhabditis belari TaxID=2138241 RepID=A0AAF3F952_9BILA